MLNLISFEFKRIFKSVFFKIIGGYCIVWPLLVTIFYRIIFGLLYKNSGMSFSDIMSDQDIKYFTWVISIAFVNELPKFIALFACLHIGKDFSNGFVRNKITGGHSRTSIFFSYMITQIAATVAFCVVYICFALLGLLITGLGVNVNGGEMFIRHLVGIATVLVFTVFSTVISMMFRKRALPIILSIVVVMFVSTVSTFFGYFGFNIPGKAVDDYIEKRDERYEDMIDDGVLSEDLVEEIQETCDKDFYLGIPWKFGRPVYVLTNLGFNGDYAVDVSQILTDSGLSDYTDEIDFSYSIGGNDMSGLGPEDFKHTDSMHLTYAELNTSYVIRSLIYILVIGGYGYIVFRKKNLF